MNPAPMAATRQPYPAAMASPEPLKLIASIEADRHPDDPTAMRFRRLFNELAGRDAEIDRLSRLLFGANPLSE